MSGRLDQAFSRAAKVRQRQTVRLAELVANGLGVGAAGNRIGLSKSETAAAWKRIKREMGRQAV